ncbi:MAG: hypothetical protein FJX25_17295 [Alphaproteobacteria bacterium]|nr:hypothetical protein [Alphaproteobacteria bacterium]
MSRARRARKAKAAPKVTLAPSPWDEGAMGPANRHRLRQEPATEIDPETGKETPNPNNVKRMRRQSWVAIYAQAGHLDKRQVAAAEKLRMAADGLRDRDPLAALNEVRVSGYSDPQAARIDARRFFHQLWADVPQASKPVLERVVIEDKAIWSGGGIAARDRHIKRLCEGLDAIA